MKSFKRIIRSFLASNYPAVYTNIQWKRIFGREINWNNPRDLNEKIQWLKRYTDTTIWTVLADKYKVREYVSNCGFNDILVKLYGKWDNVEDIDWDSLPKEFILKMNNGSGDVIICQDKDKFDKNTAISKLKIMKKEKFGASTNERHYLGIPPLIIAEELLDNTLQPIASSSLIDYKIWCFNGKPECIWTCYNRTKKGVEVATYDLDWNYHPEWSVFDNYFKKAKVLLPRPRSLEKMLLIASELSKGFPQVRVDLYEVGNKPYFGELTFTSNMGMMTFYTQEFLEFLGSKVVLPLKTTENY